MAAQKTPYIIENYDINASRAHGIFIENTDVYFIIRACVVHDGGGGNEGIRFFNVTNGKIENVTSYNNYRVCLDTSSNNIIANCTIYNNSYGIALFESSNNIIINCTIYWNTVGIGLSLWSNRNRIVNCTINNKWDGIYLYHSSNNNVINCNVYNNSYGVRLDNSSNNEIHYNNIYNNTNHGVYNRNSELEYRVDATNNWWGSASGPSGKGPGSGDKVSDNVLYNPWLTEQVKIELPVVGPKKEEMPKLGLTHIILIVGVIAVVIIIATVILGRRKISKMDIENPMQKAEKPAPEVSVPLFPVHCSNCKTTFQVEDKKRPFKTKCPNCGTWGMIR